MATKLTHVICSGCGRKTVSMVVRKDAKCSSCRQYPIPPSNRTWRAH